jgi:hypothetical protein
MWALVAAAVSLAVTIPIVSTLGRGSRTSISDIPWSLPELAQRQVIIAGGLAGYAVTGIVLLVTLARNQAEIESDFFNALVFMFITAYLFFVSTAFLFALLPPEDADGSQPARVQFGIAANLMFRSVMIAWFALVPLMQTFGLDILADFVSAAMTSSMCLGTIFALGVFHGIGIVNLTEVVLLPLTSALAAVVVGVLALTAVPELQSARATLYMTAALYAVNALTFGHFAVGLLANTVDVVRRVAGPYSRRACVIEIQVTMVMLMFLWLAVMGIL